MNVGTSAHANGPVEARDRVLLKYNTSPLVTLKVFGLTALGRRERIELMRPLAEEFAVLLTEANPAWDVQVERFERAEGPEFDIGVDGEVD